MRIYAFVERYPSAYKPYYDAQFTDLAERGHELHIYAVGPGDKPTRKLISSGVADSIQYYLPDGLAGLARFGPRIVREVLRSPRQRYEVAARIGRGTVTLRDQLKAVARMASLPLATPDLCLVHGIGPGSTLWWLRELYPEAALALYYHGEKPLGAGRAVEAALRKTLNSADVVFTNTDFSRGRIVERGARAERVVVLPVGFDLAAYAAVGTRVYRPAGKLRLISVGRLSSEKGYVVALQALAGLVTSGNRAFHYTIVGEGHLRRDLEDFVRQNGLHDCVTFTGTLANHDVIEALWQSDVLLLPSVVVGGLEETQGAVVQEAFLTGNLAIASRIGGVLESIPDALSEFVVPQHDATALANAIERLQRMPDIELRDMAESARVWTRHRYDIRLLNNRLLAEMIARKGGLRPRVACDG